MVRPGGESNSIVSESTENRSNESPVNQFYFIDSEPSPVRIYGIEINEVPVSLKKTVSEDLRLQLNIEHIKKADYLEHLRAESEKWNNLGCFPPHESYRVWLHTLIFLIETIYHLTFLILTLVYLQ